MGLGLTHPLFQELYPRGLPLGVKLLLCSRLEGIPGLQILPARLLLPWRSMQVSTSSPMGVGGGHKRNQPFMDQASARHLFSPLSPCPYPTPATFQVALAPSPGEALPVSSPFSSPLQLSAPAAPWPPGVGTPPFRAPCHPARTPTGAYPQGLRAHLPALCGCGLGLGWGQLGHGT